MPSGGRRAGTSMRLVLRLALLLTVLVVVFLSTLPAGADTGKQFREQLLELTNQYRAANGRPPLFLSDHLSQSAQDYAEAMGRLRFFGHDGPNGGNMTSRIEASGYLGWSSIGENLGAGYKTPEEVFKGWLASPTHRDNILSPDFREIGIGFSSQPNAPYVDYWVQTFGVRPGVVAAQSAKKYRYVLGFDAFHQKAAELLGEPLEDVWHLGHTGNSSLALQRTSKGLLLWLKPLNQMVFLTETHAYTYRDGRVEPLSETDRQLLGVLAGQVPNGQPPDGPPVDGPPRGGPPVDGQPADGPSAAGQPAVEPTPRQPTVASATDRTASEEPERMQP